MTNASPETREPTLGRYEYSFRSTGVARNRAFLPRDSQVPPSGRRRLTGGLVAAAIGGVAILSAYWSLADRPKAVRLTAPTATLQVTLSDTATRRAAGLSNRDGVPHDGMLGNTLEREFGIHRDHHEEFSELFKKNCDYLGIGEGFGSANGSVDPSGAGAGDAGAPRDTVTLAEPESETGLKCFVIMPFRERTEKYPLGFFDEVLRSLIAPAGRRAGFTVETANRQGTEVIHSTIINDLLDAALVVADLTEHNPNVLFELGMRMAHDRPVALIRAKGTGPVFDVDNMLRVYEYDPNLWASTVERDQPKLKEHIEATWKNREKQDTYLKLLRRKPTGT